MSQQIPTFTLDVLARSDARPTDAFLLDRRVDDPTETFGLPYRSDYYGVGLCLNGRAELGVDLGDRIVGPGSVIAMPPQAVKQ